MEYAHIGEDEESAFEIEHNPAGEELLHKRHRGAAGSNVENFFAFVQEGMNEGYFRKELSLAFFDSSAVDIFVVRKEDSGIHGQTKEVEIFLSRILIFDFLIHPVGSLKTDRFFAIIISVKNGVILD